MMNGYAKCTPRSISYMIGAIYGMKIRQIQRDCYLGNQSNRKSQTIVLYHFIG